VLVCRPCLLMDNMEKPFRAAVVRIASEPKTALRGGYLFRGLEISHDGHSDRVFSHVSEFAGEGPLCFPLLCWSGARIAAFIFS